MLKKKNNAQFFSLMVVVSAFLFCFPSSALAEIFITEIMYDMSGVDAGREWIEVFNSGTEEINLLEFYFSENGENFHNLNYNNGEYLLQGSSTVQAGEYAIISNSRDKFLEDYPNYSGNLLYGTGFTLRNTSGTVALKKGELVISQSYVQTEQADGSGNSLQLTSAQNWIAAVPTPGAQNSEIPSQVEETNNEEEAVSSSGVSETSNKTITVFSSSNFSASSQAVSAGAVKKLSINIELPSKNLFSKIPYLFKVTVLGGEKGVVDRLKWTWNFGDGMTSEENNPVHSYDYPGDYIVYVEASYGDTVMIDKASAKVVLPDISISKAEGGSGGFVELKNNSSIETDISGWSLISGGRFFRMPRGTVLPAKGRVSFPAKITSIDALSKIDLLTSGGVFVSSFLAQSGKAGLLASALVNAPIKKPIVVNKINYESSDTSAGDVDDDSGYALEAIENDTLSDSSGFYWWFGSGLGAIALSAVIFYLLKKKSGDIEIIS